jgi:hypothetical protein
VIGVELDEEVDVAALRRLTAGERSKDAHVPDPMRMRRFEQTLAPTPQGASPQVAFSP